MVLKPLPLRTGRPCWSKLQLLRELRRRRCAKASRTALPTRKRPQIQQLAPDDELVPSAPRKQRRQLVAGTLEGAALREKLLLRVEDDPFGDCPPPIQTFEELQSLPAYVLQGLRKHGIEAPLPIQAQALPLVLAGHNVIGLAQTGSGKTLAFLLPAAIHLATNTGGTHPRVLILAPTRELAVQIGNEADRVFEQSQNKTQPRGLRTACVYGGGDKQWQQRQLQRGADIVAATPGRLLDFANSGAVHLKEVSYFVLDEADRMLDYGFHEDVTEIAKHTKPKRQVLFFSATWNTAVQQLAAGLCCGGSRPVRISYGQGGGEQAGNDTAAVQAREGIVQEVIVVDHGTDWKKQETEKEAILDKHLQTVLNASEDHKVLVFVSRKDLADKVSERLKSCGFKADAMHGGKTQEYRLWVLDEFRKGRLRLLVATDVLGRGIDIPTVSHVVIHEMGYIEDYIHRIGRTARGKHGRGHALVFFEYWEGAPSLAAELIDVLRASKQSVPLDLRRIATEVAEGKRKVRNK